MNQITLHDKSLVKKKREETATVSGLDCGLIPELLDCVVDDKPVPKSPFHSDEQQSVKSA